MKRVLVSTAAVLALAACSKKTETAAAPDAGSAAAPAAASAPAGPMIPPDRKAGLWEQKMATGTMTQVSRICFSDAVNKKMSLWGQEGGKDMCQEQSVTPMLGGWKFTSTCNMGSSGVIVSRGEAKGDLSSHYTVSIRSTTTGAAAPQMNGDRTVTLEATWKGPCPADFKPGDIELPGGMKINVLTMGAGGPTGGKPSAEQVAAMRKDDRGPEEGLAVGLENPLIPAKAGTQTAASDAGSTSSALIDRYQHLRLGPDLRRDERRFCRQTQFHRHRRGLAAADAQAATPRLPPAGLQRAEQGRQDPRAGRADRVAERAGAAVDVYLARSIPRSRSAIIATTAKASFTSKRSTSFTPQPARSAPSGSPGPGRWVKRPGSWAWAAWPATRATMVMPSRFATDSRVITRAAAPSLIELAFGRGDGAVLAEGRLQRRDLRGIGLHRLFVLLDEHGALAG